MGIRFNSKGATVTPAGGTNLVTAGVGAADDTLTSITQVLNVGLGQANTWTATPQTVSLNANAATILAVSNTTAGTAAEAQLQLTCSTGVGTLECIGHTFSASNFRDTLVLNAQSGLVGGVVIMAQATAPITFYNGGSTVGNQTVSIDADGSLSILQAGGGIEIKEGSNARMGQATLAGGSVVVANTSVTASTRVFVTRATGPGANASQVAVSVTAGVSFTITSANALDNDTFNWLLFEPA